MLKDFARGRGFVFAQAIGFLSGTESKATPVRRLGAASDAVAGGTQLNAPRAVVLVDSREQNPLHFVGFKGWFAGIERKALKLGDYSVAGLEDICVERKDLADLAHSFTTEQASFIDRPRAHG